MYPGSPENRPRAGDAGGHGGRPVGCRVIRRILLAASRRLRQAEVENLHLPVVEDEHVLRLEIAVDDAARVRRFEAARDLPDDGRAPCAAQAALRAGRRGASCLPAAP